MARIPKTVRNTIITIFIFIILFVVGGVAYVFIVDRSGPKHAPPIAAGSNDQVLSMPKPVAPSPNAAEGVAIESVTSPVAAGSNSSVSVRTNAGSACTISVAYNGVPSTDSGLAPREANPYGNVTWSWTVGSSVPAGNWPVKVICTYHGRSGVSVGNIEVTKQP